MTRFSRVIITLLALCLCFQALAVAPPLLTDFPQSQLTPVSINWAACPTSGTAVISETIFLDSISFGVAGTGRTVTLADRQSSPITVMTAISLSANQFTTIRMPGVRFSSGMTLTCSGAGVVYQFTGKVKR